MRKILLLMILVFSYCNIYAQTAVTISGEGRPEINKIYNYRIPVPHGISGTKATWKVVNGYFNDIDKSTTITQNVDLVGFGVDVIWAKAGETGTISYSYTNGSSISYQGVLSVSIESSSTGGGGDLVALSIPPKIFSGDRIVFGFAKMDDRFSIESWEYNTNLFTEVGRTKTTITLLIKPVIGWVDAKVKVNLLEKSKDPIMDFLMGREKIGRSWDFRVFGIPLLENNIGRNEGEMVCDGNTITYSIHNAQNIVWTAGDRMTLISGQGTPSATFKASGNGYGQVRVTAIGVYDNKSYNLESKPWVGAPLARVTRGDIPQKTSDYYDSLITIPSSFTFGVKTSMGMDVLGGTGNSLDYEWTGYTYNGVRSISSLDGKKTVTNGKINESAVIIELDPYSYASLPRSYSFGIRAQNKCGNTVSKSVSWIGLVDSRYLSKSAIEEEVSSTATLPSSIRIYNLSSGLLVHTEKNVTDFNIENTKLRAGIYIVEKTHEDGSVTREKVMKKY